MLWVPWLKFHPSVCCPTPLHLSPPHIDSTAPLLSSGPPGSCGGSTASLTSIEAFTPADAAADGAYGGSAVVAVRRVGEGARSRPGSGAASTSGRGTPLARQLLAGQLNGVTPVQWQAEAERLIGEGCHAQAVLMVGPTSGTVKCYVR